MRQLALIRWLMDRFLSSRKQRSSWRVGLTLGTAFLGLQGPALFAQNTTGDLKLDTGKEIWDAACISCHGVDGRGAVRTSVGFDARLPDFTDCSFATKEPDVDWSSTIHNGGPARGFSPI